VDKQLIVLISAKGSGKTRMSVWIEENNSDIQIHIISAQKSLNMPQVVSPTEIDLAEERLLYRDTNKDQEWLKKYGKKTRRWGENPETHLLNDFTLLMEYLMTENYQNSIEFGIISKKIKR